MASKVSIISNAFNYLGKGQVNDLDASPATQAASSLYDTLYLAMLGSHPWTFALQIGYELSKINSQTGVDEWQYIYQIPSDLIRAYRVRPLSIFRRFKDKIYSNESELFLDYTQYVSEEKLPSDFIFMMQAGVAAECAMMITNDRSIQQQWMQIQAIRLLRAMGQDGQGQTNEYIRSQPIFEAHAT